MMSRSLWLTDPVRFYVLFVWLVERLHVDLCRLTGCLCR
ncbi:putative leader peptide [Streptosporangium sp. NPDC002524]